MQQKLKGKKIAFLATDGFEQVELTRPWEDIQNAGAMVELVSLKTGEIQGMNHADTADTFSVDKTVDEVISAEYDGLVLPGGVQNPDALRLNQRAMQFVKEFFEQEKPVAAICHGPWTLAEAGVLKGRTVTSWPSLKTDIENAGGRWVDEDVHVDKGLVTSRKPDDLDEFCAKAIEEFCEGKQEKPAV
ncbi:type 1 glutamine amidotransferase domain-containing protein [uncultured Sneathiella sp.]|jgi:protease I|uniref:type 1 glutamine amidotransferase domain-containing protein n=1 Tax=uncultured Sneathiella sp. TaxID=879315 RepID=UPI0030DA807E|tara:strand:+ start:143 stop:706 length:564 start_codon:yes stop_codon:yes gene_type:complete